MKKVLVCTALAVLSFASPKIFATEAQDNDAMWAAVLEAHGLNREVAQVDGGVEQPHCRTDDARPVSSPEQVRPTPDLHMPANAPADCVPLGATIPFTVRWGIASPSRFVGGTIPDGATVGIATVVTKGSVPASTPYMTHGTSGTLYLAAATQWGASPYSPSYGYPATDFDWTSNSVDFYGYVNLSPVAQQEILTQYPAGACVTGVAFDVDHTYNNLTRGRVYLYLNGTGHGLSLPFGDEAF